MGAKNNKKTKILITGTNGQLGRCLQVVSGKYPNYDFHLKTSKQLDITRKEQIDILFAQEKFDFCINCAAYTAVDKAESNHENAFLVNAEAVKYLAETCKTNTTTLIHISTDSVFDGTKDTPYTEDDLPNPINVYGASKLKGEQYIQEILNNYFIIRTCWVYSEYGHNFVKTMLRLGAERDKISVVNDQIGSPAYAGDFAKAIMEIISAKTTSFELYHYTNEGITSWHHFAKTIFEIKEIKIKVNPISPNNYITQAKRPMYSVLDETKIKQVFNINSIPNLENSLKEVIYNTR
jgi:dTDP-4-dehydrorhamnose reductase